MTVKAIEFFAVGAGSSTRWRGLTDGKTKIATGAGDSLPRSRACSGRFCDASSLQLDQHCQNDDSLGRVQFSVLTKFRPDLNADRRTEKRIETEIIIFLAGSIAESQITRRPWKKCGGGHDFHEAVGLGSYLFNGKLLGAYIDWLWVLTREMINTPLHRSLIKAVARELLKRKTLSYSRARQIMSAVREAWRRQQQLRQKSAPA